MAWRIKQLPQAYFANADCLGKIAQRRRSVEGDDVGGEREEVFGVHMNTLVASAGPPADALC